MSRAGAAELRLSSNVIELLLPYRRPFLMVDCVTAYERSAQPTLWASRSISANEDVFRGHFPELHLWPGVLTQEGLGQSSNLLAVILSLQRGREAAGGDADDVLVGLRNLELGFRLHPGFRPERSAELLAHLPKVRGRVGMSGAVEMKFLRPVFAGEQLDYRVCLTQEFGEVLRCEVEASVAGEPAARGVISGSFSRLRPALESVP